MSTAHTTLSSSMVDRVWNLLTQTESGVLQQADSNKENRCAKQGRILAQGQEYRATATGHSQFRIDAVASNGSLLMVSTPPSTEIAAIKPWLLHAVRAHARKTEVEWGHEVKFLNITNECCGRQDQRCGCEDLQKCVSSPLRNTKNDLWHQQEV